MSEACNHKALAKRVFLLTNTVNVPFIIVTSLTPVITLWKLKPTAGFQKGYFATEEVRKAGNLVEVIVRVTTLQAQ